MDKRALTIQSHGENGTPEAISFSDLTFRPLGYAELRDAILHRPINIPLVGSGTVVDSNVDQVPVGQKGEFRTTLESRFSSTCIGLVRGGWLPSAIALEDNSIVLPDRCVVAQLNARLRNGAPKAEAQSDFVDLFAGSAVRINPLLFVLEGDSKQNPTPETLERHLNEAVSKIKSALPKAVLVAANSLGLKGVLGLIDDTQRSMVRKQSFLVKLNPILKSPTGGRQVQAQCDQVLIAAEEHEIPRSSLVVLAALSTVVVPNGNSPAKRLLKFRDGYTEADAYNALADLRSLEILMHIFAFYPDQRVMLCTADKDLALYWVGLHASNFEFRNGRMTVDLSPSDLLPGIPTEHLKNLLVSP